MVQPSVSIVLLTAGLGAERFMPSTNDFPLEVEKCTRILRTYAQDCLTELGIFTEEGVAIKDKNIKVTYVLPTNRQEKNTTASNPRCQGYMHLLKHEIRPTAVRRHERHRFAPGAPA